MNHTSTLKICKSLDHSFRSRKLIHVLISNVSLVKSEHFGSHERIELQEENKERKFQGLSELDAEAMHKLHEQEDEAIESRQAAAASSAQVTGQPTPDADGMKITYQRPPKRPDNREQLKGAVREANQKSEWGTGEDGYMRPKTSADKLRYNYFDCSSLLYG